MMNGIDRISRRLTEEAEAEIAALKAETADKRRAVLEEYEEKAQKAYEERMREGTAECELKAQRCISTAEMEVRKATLAYKQELVGKAFEAAKQMLTALPKEQYVQFLAAQAAKATTYGTEELIFNARDAAAVGRDVEKAANALLRGQGKPGKLTVSEETREIPGGVIVRQGNIEVNCSVDTLVDMRRSELATQVAEILLT